MFKIKYISKEKDKVVYDNTIIIEKITEFLYRNDDECCYISLNSDLTINNTSLNGFSEVYIYIDENNNKWFKIPDPEDDYSHFSQVVERIVEYCYTGIYNRIANNNF